MFPGGAGALCFVVMVYGGWMDALHGCVKRQWGSRGGWVEEANHTNRL